MAEHSFRRLAAALSGLLLVAGGAAAQQPLPPPAAGEEPPRTIRPEPLPPLPPGPPSGSAEPSAPTAAGVPEPDSAATPAGPAETREFCGQSVSYALADRDGIPERYRAFVGIWSDASWTPQICAALIVQDVRPDGTASILYVFGPMSSNARAAGGILRGTGIVRDGELRFQNSDGSQFAFRPLYADLDGRLTMPGGQTYQAVFKKTL